jgi:PAS domain S-box-containing protein
LVNDLEIFRALYWAYPDGVLLVDEQGVIRLANPAVTTLLGYSPGELVGQPVDMLVPDSVAPRHATYRHGYALAPRTRPMGTELELKAKRADGSEVMVEIALSPLRVGAGVGDGEGGGEKQTGANYVVASVRGIGAYPRVKRAMQRARYNEFVVQLGRVAVDTMNPDELLRRVPDAVVQALEAQGVGVFLITPNQLELRMVSHAGPRARTVGDTGPRAEEVRRFVYANRADTMPGYVVAQRAPVLVANFSREQRFDVPTRLLQLGAQSALAVPLADRGKVIGVLGAWSSQLNRFADDELAFMEALASLLSTSLQRALAESQLRHAQRMESVGQLTGGIAHDFNNLLTVIQGNLQMLADLPAVSADALAPQLVAAASRAGQRGADLTGKLLAFSRRQPLAPTALDPAAMLNSLADMLRRTLGEHIRVQVFAPAGLPHCLADPVQLEAALLNIAINARDAIADHAVPAGLLVLRCGAGWLPKEQTGPASASVGPQPGRPGVWFSVQDNGCGMSADVRERAFEPFFTTKEAGRGTGLGLSTVYGFVTQSHGHIQLDSTPGVGTTLTLTLPAQTAPAASGDVEMGAIDLPHGLRVLLVEDDADVRAVAQAFLQTMGCQVQACASAEEALATLAAQPIDAGVDLLLSDITLGGSMDGIALAHQVQRQQPTLAVLLCSGYSRFLLDDPAGAEPFGAVLKKPFTPPELARAMLHTLHRHQRSA